MSGRAISQGAALRTWVLEFEGIPPGPNDSMSLRERMRTRKSWRVHGWLSASRAGIPPLQRIRVSAVFVRRAVGVADEDNDHARLKPILDGIVKAGVIPNDTRKHVEWGDVTEKRGPRGLRLVIEAVEV